MRIALTVLLIAHGALHLLGFVKWWPLSTISQLHSPTPAALVSSPANSRTFASYWLLACLLLLAAAFLLSQGNRDWYQAAFAGLILSQILIVFAWRDAKFGTMPNLLVLVPVIAAAANARFKHQFEDEAVALLAASTQTPGSEVQAAELDGLPPPVQRWLERAGVVGKARARSLWLRQEGQLRTSPSGPWLAATAEQYFSIDAPGFVWNVDTHLYGFLPVAGRDDYRGGTGRMSIKAASVLSLVDARGPKIDSGAMLRFLGEMVWFPSGALSAHVAWAPVDDRTAIATFNDQGKSVDATFEVDASGRVVAIHALRYRGGGVDAVLTPWIVSCSAWDRFTGVEVPVEGDVAWQLPNATFSYYRWRVIELKYDPSNLCTKSRARRRLRLKYTSGPARL